MHCMFYVPYLKYCIADAFNVALHIGITRYYGAQYNPSTFHDMWSPFIINKPQAFIGRIKPRGTFMQL